MSNGSLERESARDTQCTHCGRFYRNDGIHSHEDNCEFRDVEARVVDLEGREDRPEVSPDVETPDPTPDGVGADPDPMGSTPREDLATDGGPRDPPAPDVQDDVDDDPGDPDVDDLPDRYMPVEEYLAELEESDADVGALEERLADYDVVDLQASSARELSAHTLQEVA